jgi:hypothetical protein
MLYRLLLVDGNGEARAATLSVLTLREFRGPYGLSEEHWFLASDWLIVVSNVSALCFVAVPLIALESPSHKIVRLCSAVCAATAIMLAGYIPSILAHYQFFYRLTKDRTNPTFWEGILIALTGVSALMTFIFTYRI